MRLTKKELHKIRNSIKENEKERLKFVDFWSEYVLTHDDKTWSRQQNKIINSCLRSSKITKEEYLKMKGER
jgi:hypothetical protein